MEEAAERSVHVVLGKVGVMVKVVVKVMAKVAWDRLHWHTRVRAMTSNCKLQTLILAQRIRKTYKTTIHLHINLLVNAGPERLNFYQVILKRISLHLRPSIHG
jgi:hypothetical protein